VRIPYPFSAIVAQTEMKQALRMAAVDPGIGGVLLFGDRGTGKSTAIRALAALLPPMQQVSGCPFHCAPENKARVCPSACPLHEREDVEGETAAVPVVDLPLGATEDRVVGALDLERALTSGTRAFQPGLLAKAHRGFLYIDEVNLLEDHLVDLLLDVAASGENLIEREGLSVRHPARFVLIGSGNPEEGELRPQLLDRFGLSVEVRTPSDIDERVEVIRRREAFDADSEAFLVAWREEESSLREELAGARARLDAVATPPELLRAAAELCVALGTDGLRGELTLVRAARALAALESSEAATVDHLKRVAPSSLRHRLRRDPLDEGGSTARVDRALGEVLGA